MAVMELRQLTRPVLAGSASSILGRLFGPYRPAAFPRTLSTTAALRADPPSSDPSRPAWPPARPPRSDAAQLREPVRKTQLQQDSPGMEAAVDALYSSSANPADWAVWSADDFYKRHTAGQPRGPRIRLRPSTGRTVHVSGNVDQARAFQMVTVLCKRNQVNGDFHRQRFHERPGMKRKRLRSERWRRRFRDSFKATINRVTELAKQGW